ncbi:MAG: carbonic anhydrase, partial [bacterium]
MNYKRIIKNQKTRFFILRFLKWLPSRLMLQLQYFVKLNRFLNLTNPKRFTEKIQHYKLYYRNETMLICTDKYL